MTGWFGLLITSMNMIPVGQLDGGHIIYSMFGSKLHNSIAHVFMIILVLLGISGIIEGFIDVGFTFGWSGWLFWAAILFFVIKIKHPPVRQFEELDYTRKTLGFFSLFILVISFAPSPFIISF